MFSTPSADSIYYAAQRQMDRCQLIDDLCAYLLAEAQDKAAFVLRFQHIQDWFSRPLSQALVRSCHFMEQFAYTSQSSTIGAPVCELKFYPTEEWALKVEPLILRFTQSSSSLSAQIFELRAATAAEHAALYPFTENPLHSSSAMQQALREYERLQHGINDFKSGLPAALRAQFFCQENPIELSNSTDRHPS